MQITNPIIHAKKTLDFLKNMIGLFFLGKDTNSLSIFDKKKSLLCLLPKNLHPKLTPKPFETFTK